MEANFSGYVTKAGLKCTDGRTIMPEAFKHQDKMRVPLVWNHGHDDAGNVLGHAILEAREDGVYGYGYFNSTPQGVNAQSLVEHGDIVSMSIYANGLLEKKMGQSGKQVLHGSIREVSLVLAGANDGAKIDQVRIAHADGEIETLADEAIITTGLPLEHADHEESDEDLEHADDGPTMQDIYDGLSEDKLTLFEYMLGAAASGDTGALAQSALSHDDSGLDLKKVYDSLSQDELALLQYMVGETLDNADGDLAQSGMDDDDELDEDADPIDILESMNEQQQTLVHSMVKSATDTATEKVTAEMTASTAKDGISMNVFEEAARQGADLRHAARQEARKNLTPDRIKTLLDDGQRLGSLKESFLMHAGDYGIDNIDLLFPDAQLDANGITTIQRRNEWVAAVLAGVRKTPFGRIKSISADITAEEARARGYVKGNLKKDEVVKMLRRITTPKTIYKKQKLDRDDIIDITEIDVVAWLKAEMRVMLDEEIARAILIGDGRDADDEDKIDEDHIRPIAFDIDMYTDKVNLPNGFAPADLVDLVVRAQDNYKGTGTPTLYTTKRRLTDMLLSKDTQGRRLYATKAELSAAMLVDDIIPVEVMEQQPDLVGVLVNLVDYTVGADKGGEVSMFDDFDIDFNQQKYLIETRISGALTRPKGAVALFVAAAQIVTAVAPTFVNSTGVLTIPTVTGVDYYNHKTGVKYASGAQASVPVGTNIEVQARPQTGYGLTHGTERDFEFTRTA